MAKTTKKQIAKTPAKKTTSKKDERMAKALPLSVGKAKALPEGESQAGQRLASTPEVEPETTATTEPESATATQDGVDPKVSHGESTSDADDPNVSKSEPEAAGEAEAELGLDELEPTEEVLADLAHAEAASPAPTASPEVTTATDANEPASEDDATPTKRARTFAHDDRLPPVGTTIKKVDRHGNVRCECTVEADGIRFDGTLYSSLSGAASAAAKQLGIRGSAQNGYVFFGIQKPSRPATDPVEALTAAWERFHARATALLDDASNDERVKLVAALTEHGLLEAFRPKVS